jgi:hypothetical protein
VNTAQLVVLSYAGLAVVGVLLLQALTENSVTYRIGAIAVTAAVLIYLLKPHPLARKRSLAIAVLLPILVGALGLAGWMWNEGRRTAQEQKQGIENLASMAEGPRYGAQSGLSEETIQRVLQLEKDGKLTPEQAAAIADPPYRGKGAVPPPPAAGPWAAPMAPSRPLRFPRNR